MPTTTAPPDDAERSVAIDSYSTVLGRSSAPEDRFRAYRRDVHGRLCSRVPTLGYSVQHQFAQAASSILFSDEQKVFDETVADTLPNGAEPVDRIHVHCMPREGKAAQPAELLRTAVAQAIAAANQVAPDVEHLMRAGVTQR